MQIICLAEAEGQRQLGMVRQLGSFFFHGGSYLTEMTLCVFLPFFFFAMIEKGGGLFLLHKKGDGKLHWYYSNQPFCLRRKRLQFFLDKYLEASVRRNFLKKVC